MIDIFTIPELLKFLDHNDTKRCSWSSEYIDTSIETMPSEFISFAEEDLDSFLNHKYINALSNAKRALDCQTDRLLKLLGYYKESQDKFWGFPKKIEVLQRFQIIAPRVLNKINKTRNLMEHQYVKPNGEQVEDFLDIVSLFIASTDRYVTNFAVEVRYGNDEDIELHKFSDVAIVVDSVNSKLTVQTGSKSLPTTMMNYEFNKNEQNYIEIFKRHLKKIEYI